MSPEDGRVDAEGCGDGVIGGAIPNTIVVGFGTGEAGLEYGPLLRSRTAASRSGYHEGEEGASIGKSRIYTSKGRPFEFAGALFSRASKNSFAGRGVLVLLLTEDG